MQKKIHPKYMEISATCSCGNRIKVYSTLNHNINIDVCGMCHPFYTGKHRIIDTSGRVERFNKRFKISKTTERLLDIKKKNTQSY